MIVTVLNILSVCKAKGGIRVVPPLTDNNTADGKIGRAVTIVSVRCYCPDEALEMRRHSGLCNLNSG